MLRGCRAKIRRAEECVQNLNREIEAFLNSDPAPHSLTREFQDNGYSYVFIARAERPVPDRFAVLAGEIVHHLASSLDHLFAALVIKNNGTIKRTHYFPLFLSEREFRKASAKGLMDDISASAKIRIEAVQPWTASNPPDTILAAVKQLNNTDKHRLLLILTAAGRLGDTITMGGDGSTIVGMKEAPPRVEISESGVELYRVLLAEPAPQFYASAKVDAQIVFAHCGLATMVPVTQVLPAMVAGVSHTIDCFRDEFDPGD